MWKSLALCALLVLAVVGTVFYQHAERSQVALDSMRSELVEAKAQLEVSAAEVIVLTKGLEDAQQKLASQKKVYQELQTRFAELEKKYTQLDTSYSSLSEQSDDLREDIEEFHTSIEQSLAWYQQNARLGTSVAEQVVKGKIEYECYEKRGGECRIKLGCFFLVNKEKLGLDYLSDEASVQRSDKILNLTDFLTNKGGDCEDYSLFFKAELNHLVQKCGDMPVVLEGWNQDEGSLVNYWLNFQQTWFIRGATQVDIPFIHPSIICGNLLDKQKNKLSGHCMIALSKEPMEDVSDLDGAYVIEPQDGSYHGRIGEDIFLIDKSQGGSWINTVITDADFHLFKETWDSYALFGKRLEDLTG